MQRGDQPVGSAGLTSLFTAPEVLYGPLDLERDFDIAADYAAEVDAAEELRGRPWTHEHITRPLVHLPELGELPDDGPTIPGDVPPMYTKPVLSACTASGSGSCLAAVAGHLLLTWKWTRTGWEDQPRIKLKQDVRYVSMAFVSGDKEVVLGATDGQAYVVQLATGKVIEALTHVEHGLEPAEHASFYVVNSVRSSPRGRFIATAGGNGDVIVWDAVSKDKLYIAKYVNPDFNDPSTGAPPLRLADQLKPESHALMAYKPMQIDAMRACDLSGDDRWLAAGGEAEVVEIWDLTKIKDAHKNAASTTSLARPFRRLFGHDGWINAVSFSLSSATLASLDIRGLLIVCDVNTGTRRSTIKTHGSVGTDLCFVPSDEGLVVTGGLDCYVKVWSLHEAQSSTTTHSKTSNTSRDRSTTTGRHDHATPVAQFRSHCSGVGSVCCFSRRPARQKASAVSLAKDVHDGPVYILSRATDQRLVLTSFDKQRCLRNTVALGLHVYSKGKQENESAMRLAVLSRTGFRLATCRYKDMRVHVWTLDNGHAGELLADLGGHRRSISAVAFGMRDEGLIAAGDESGKVCVWRLTPHGHGLEDPSDDATVFYTKANLPWLKSDDGLPRRQQDSVQPHSSWTEHEAPIRSLRFDEQDLLLVSCDAIGVVYVVHIATREVVHTIHGADVFIGPVLLASAAPIESSSSSSSNARRGTWSRNGASYSWFLVTHSRSDLLVWRAETGQVYARHRVVAETDDCVLSMDCVRVEDELRVCASSLRGALVVWGVNCMSPAQSWVCDLRDSLGVSRDLTLQIVQLETYGRCIIALGPSYVCMWEDAVRKVDQDRAPSAATPPDQVPHEYVLSYAEEVETARFMHGPKTARRLSTGLLRLVVAEGWILNVPV